MQTQGYPMPAGYGTERDTARGYEKAAALLQRGRPKGQRKRLSGRETYLRLLPDDAIAVTLYSTDVVTLYPDGRTVLNTGGWRTVTTKERMNRFLPEGWSVWSDRSVWYLGRGPWTENPEKYTFEDGIAIDGNGNVSGTSARSPKELQALNRLCGRYARKFVAALFAGEVPAPSGGDCWHCHLQTGNGQSLGESLDSPDHILRHMDNDYFVPSLAVNAVNRFPVSDAARQDLSHIWGQHDSGHFMPDIAERQIRNSIRRYVKEKLGLSA